MAKKAAVTVKGAVLELNSRLENTINFDAQFYETSFSQSHTAQRPYYKEKTLKLRNSNYKFFDTGGKKPVLLFIHGFGAGKYTMNSFLPEFSSTFRCISLDLPGHNGLGVNKISSLTDYAHYVEKFILANKIEEVTLVGYSLGGLVSLKLVELNTPTRSKIKIKSMIVLSSPIMGSKEGLRTGMKAIIPISKKFPRRVFSLVVKSEITYKLVNAFNKLMGMQDTVSKDVVSKLELENARKVIEIIDKASVVVPDNTPSLFIFDKYDVAVSTKNYDYVKKLEKENLEVCMMERVGHLRSKEGQEVLVAKLRDFVLKF